MVVISTETKSVVKIMYFKPNGGTHIGDTARDCLCYRCAHLRRITSSRPVTRAAVFLKKKIAGLGNCRGRIQGDVMIQKGHHQSEQRAASPI